MEPVQFMSNEINGEVPRKSGHITVIVDQVMCNKSSFSSFNSV